MERVRRCSKCGEEVFQGGSFCPYCGNIIEDERVVKNERNRPIPDISFIKTETSKTDMKWYIAAVMAVLEIVSGFMPWVTWIQGEYWDQDKMSCGCTYFLELLSMVLRSDDWEFKKLVSPLVFVSMLGFIMIFLNGFFIVRVFRKKSAEQIGISAGLSGIVVSVGSILAMQYFYCSLEDFGWSEMSVNTETGAWMMLLAGIALIGIIIFYKSDTETE